MRRLAVLLLVAGGLPGRLFAQCPAGTTAAVQQSPVNVNVADGSPVTFNWSAASGSVTGYEVFVDSANSAVCPTTAATSCTTTNALNTGTHVWGVRAHYANCTLDSAQPKSFTVGCPTTSASLQSPANGATNVSLTPTLTWSSVSSANVYDIQFSTQGGGGCSGSGLLATSSSTSFNMPQLNASTTYEWRIAAKKNGTTCPSTFSQCFTFTTGPSTTTCTPPGSFALTSPANGDSVSSSPTLSWTAAANGDKYVVHIGTTNPPAATPNDAVVSGTSYKPNLAAGTYYWSVDAYAKCNTTNAPAKTSSTVSSFTVASCPTAAPALIRPQSNAPVASPVTFEWSSVAGATSYRVWAAAPDSSRSTLGTTTATTLTVPVPQGPVTWLVEARFDTCPSTFSGTSSFFSTTPTTCDNPQPALLSPGNFATNVESPVDFKWSHTGASSYTLYLNDTAVGTTGDTELTRLVPAGTSTWYVVASFAGCSDVKSPVFTFSTKPASTSCPGGSITLASPANGATVASPVTLQWSGVSGANAYRVWASLNGGSPAVVARTAQTAIAALPLPAGSIDWYVEALFDTCPSIASPHGTFTVRTAATCSNNVAPTLTSPANGSSVAPGSVTFQWSVPPTNAPALYRVWVSDGDDPFTDVGTTTSTKLTRDNLEPGSVIWYVEALFEGCPVPLASAKATFTLQGAAACTTAAPAIVSPPNGATNVPSPVELTWTAVPGAEEYRVYASLDGGELRLIAESDDTTVTKTLPPGVIAWVVEADLEECPSTRSAVSKFTIQRNANCNAAPPQLVAPADLSTVSSAQVRFDWNPVSGAIGYAVFAEHDDGAPTRIAETTDTEITRTLPPGEIEWWVVAFFNGCPAAESAHFSFAIPEPQNCSRTVKPLLQSPADSATPIASPVHFSWSEVPGAKSYKVWASLAGAGASVIGTTTGHKLSVDLPAGSVAWFVEADFDTCPSVVSAPGAFVVRRATACGTPDRPTAKAPAQVASATPYTVRWTAVEHATSFELQESPTSDFSNVTTTTVTGFEATLAHTVTKAQRWYYRVRAISDCSDQKSAESKVVSVVVIPLETAQRHTTVEVGAAGGITQLITLPGQTPPVTFSARGDKPWITVSPSTGTLGPNGAVLTVTFAPATLALGANTGTVLITYGTAGKTGTTGASAPGSVPVSVSLVTPVQPGGKGGPIPESLIIPAVGHAAGANNSLFESDVRIANTSAQLQKYQLNFTLSGTNGTQSGQSTSIQIDPGATMALDDILSSFFGLGSDSGSATGTLEIRPLTSTSTSTSLGTTAKTSVQTVASSRTYNTTATGTFGQFIPAIAYSQFLAAGGGRITLQQIAQSAAYRTNFGLVEGSGQPADVVVHVFDNAGNEIGTIPISLLAGEHKQINGFLAANNISLTDGRIEVEVTSATGKVTAYASTVDNATNDPLLVLPVLKGAVTSNRYVIPGVADINNGLASWRSDVRIFNAGASAATATLTYVPQPGNTGAAGTVQYTIAPGEVKALDNAMQSIFGLTNTGGALVITTDSPSSLVATARTYNQTAEGTYGQFIPGVTPADSVGAGERTLQVLQLESSTRFRTNVGVTETTGNPVTVLVTAIPSDSKIAASTTLTLAPNEFRQFSLDSFNLGTLYNARVTVKVTGGSGKVTAYGSVIDQVTQDPTYVPAQ